MPQTFDSLGKAEHCQSVQRDFSEGIRVRRNSLSLVIAIPDSMSEICESSLPRSAYSRNSDLRARHRLHRLGGHAVLRSKQYIWRPFPSTCLPELQKSGNEQAFILLAT